MSQALPDVRAAIATEPHTPAVADLRQHFGVRYRIRREAGGVTWNDAPKEERLWLLELPCRYGLIYPQGGAMLAAWTDHPRIAAKLRALPCTVNARGDVETVVTFNVNDAEAVFRILKPCRRRRLPDAQRLRNAENLVRARQHRQESLTQSDFPGPESTEPGQERATLGDVSADTVPGAFFVRTALRLERRPRRHK